MNKLLKIFSIILVLVCLASCGSSAMQETSINFREHTATNGRVVGSVTFVNSKPMHNTYWITFSNTSADNKIARRNSKSVAFSANTLQREFVGELDLGRTYLYTIDLEVGDYDLASMLFIRDVGAYTEYARYSGFSIPFKSEKGKITYLGNVVIDESKMGEKSFINLKNSYERDINTIRKTYPEVIWTRALNDTTRKIEYQKEITSEVRKELNIGY